MTESVRLYSSRICGWAKRNYSALLEKETPFKLVPANDSSGNKTAEFLSLTPARKTPVLHHQDIVVWESRIINEYVEEAFSGISLLPSEPGMRARARSLNCFCDDTLMPLLSRIARNNGLEEATQELANALVLLNRFASPTTSPGPYWAGPAFSLVDICYLNFFDNLVYVTGLVDGLSFKLSGRLEEWSVAISERPSVTRASAIADTFATHEVETIITA